MAKMRVQQHLEIDTNADGFLTAQVLTIESSKGENPVTGKLNYRPIVQEILKIGMKNFKQNCINAIYSHFGTQAAVAEALGMQRTYISRVINQRKRRIENEKNLICNDGNGDSDVDGGPNNGGSNLE